MSDFHRTLTSTHFKEINFLHFVKCLMFQTVCIWKNGKETVECINRDLGEIPEGIEPSTQVIDVQGNSIPVLTDDIFVDVSKCSIYCLPLTSYVDMFQRV